MRDTWQSRQWSINRSAAKLSLDTIPGLESIIMKDLVIPGQEEEDDASLYDRYLIRARREAVSGNKAHYKKVG
ncbi:baseplate J/gp47 family protein [Bacillus sp. SL00103]